jgi:hypothetical protein
VRVLYASLPSDVACAALCDAGLHLAPDDLQVERREERWAVLLPDDRIAWFPASDEGLRRLVVERRVLRLLGDRCAFRVPRLLHESAAGFDVRARVPGICDPWGAYRRLGEDRRLAARIGRSLGAILAEQHTRVAHADVLGWLPERPSWPEPGAWIRERVPEVVADAEVIAAADEVLSAYEAVRLDADDRVLVHSDLGLHNLALDPDTADVRGVFDYDSAAWADRHHDFRYLVFDRDQDEMLDAALAVYEPAVGRRVSRRRVRLYNAVCAFSYLAYRLGVPPDAKSCGRTLAEDLGWVRHAVARARSGSD